MKKEMNAITLRNILIALVLIALVGAGAGFYMGFGWIRAYSQEVNAVVVSASINSDSSSSTGGLQQQLEKQQAIITTANSLFALSSNYQTQAIKDIYTYAGATGISVSDIKLAATSAKATNTSGSSGSSATKAVTVSLKSPVGYTSLLRFLSYIEANIPKMQISGIDLSRPSDGSSNNVSITNVTISIYVR